MYLLLVCPSARIHQLVSVHLVAEIDLYFLSTRLISLRPLVSPLHLFFLLFKPFHFLFCSSSLPLHFVPSFIHFFYHLVHVTSIHLKFLSFLSSIFSSPFSQQLSIASCNQHFALSSFLLISRFTTYLQRLLFFLGSTLCHSNAIFKRTRQLH